MLAKERNDRINLQIKKNKITHFTIPKTIKLFHFGKRAQPHFLIP